MNITRIKDMGCRDQADMTVGPLSCVFWIVPFGDHRISCCRVVPSNHTVCSGCISSFSIFLNK